MGREADSSSAFFSNRPGIFLTDLLSLGALPISASEAANAGDKTRAGIVIHIIPPPITRHGPCEIHLPAQG